MTYGYVNRNKGEDEKFLNGTHADEIIYNDRQGFDFSFANKGDKVIFNNYKSVADSVEEFLNFCVFIQETGIDYFNTEGPIDTSVSYGKLINNICASIGRYAEENWSKEETND